MGFEPTEAINLTCFQDKSFKPLSHLSNKTPRRGIEPLLTVLETVVLPLHHQDKRDRLYIYPTPTDKVGGGYTCYRLATPSSILKGLLNHVFYALLARLT